MRELTIDWAALHSAFQMNMPEVRCFLCIDDGRVLKLPPGDPLLATVRAEPHRYLLIDAIPSRIQYQWLDDFIKNIPDETVRLRLEAAINGKGAFRRFKDILLSLPEERRRWFEYRDQMMRHRIVEWINEQAIVATNEPPWGALPELPATAVPPAATPIHVGAMLGSEDNLGNQVGLAAPHHHGMAAVPHTNGYHHRPYTPTVAPAHHHVGSIGGTMQELGNGYLNMPPPLKQPKAPQIPTSQQEVEALRDFLIEWNDTHTPGVASSPIELEQLAVDIAKNFAVRPIHA